MCMHAHIRKASAMWKFLNQARAWFLRIALLVCVCVCVDVCVCVRPRGYELLVA